MTADSGILVLRRRRGVEVLSMALVLLLAAVMLGCGSGNGAAPSANAPITKAQALAFTHAVNLRHADVRHLTEGTAPHLYMRVRLQEELASCAGTESPATHLLSLLASPRFAAVRQDHQSVLVLSGVSVWASPAFARAQHPTDTRRGRACVAQFMPRLARLTPATSASVHLLPAPVPNIGATEVRMRAVPPSAQVPTYIDLISFLCGPAEIELDVTTTAKPSTPGFEKELLSTLYNRARASELIAKSASGCSSANHHY